jgi:hypothetical protein
LRLTCTDSKHRNCNFKNVFRWFQYKILIEWTKEVCQSFRVPDAFKKKMDRYLWLFFLCFLELPFSFQITGIWLPIKRPLESYLPT